MLTTAIVPLINKVLAITNALLCWHALLERRMSQTKTLEEQLFVLMMLGDDRVIDETIIAGVSRYKKA